MVLGQASHLVRLKKVGQNIETIYVKEDLEEEWNQKRWDPHIQGAFAPFQKDRLRDLLFCTSLQQSLLPLSGGSNWCSGPNSREGLRNTPSFQWDAEDCTPAGNVNRKWASQRQDSQPAMVLPSLQPTEVICPSVDFQKQQTNQPKKPLC